MSTYSILDNTIFETQSNQDKDILLKISEIITFKKDDQIVKEGDKADYAFILLKGSLSVIGVTEDNQKFEISKLKKGELFGESALFDNKKRNASIVANVDSDVLMIPADKLNEISSVETKNLYQTIAKTALKRQKKTNIALGEEIKKLNEACKIFLFSLVWICLYACIMASFDSYKMSIQYAVLQNIPFSIVSPLLVIWRIKFAEMNIIKTGAACFVLFRRFIKNITNESTIIAAIAIIKGMGLLATISVTFFNKAVMFPP